MKNRSLKNRFLHFLKYFVLIGMLLSVLSQVANAQTQNIRFKHLTVNDGLSHSWVHSIIQDKQGFMWFGTDDGLNRYDGYDFRIYKNNIRDQYSISSSCVLAMIEDIKGNFWIGTRQGLNYYDRTNERFIRRHELSQGEILSIAEDRDSTIWIGTTLNIMRLDLKNDSLYSYAPNIVSQNRVTRSAGGHRAIIIDGRNHVWITSSYGLLLYNKENDSFINYYHDNEDPLSIGSNDLYSIMEDKFGRLWLGSSEGLELFSNAFEYSRKGIFIHQQNIVNNQKSISRGTVLCLFEDNKHNLWIGTENGGLDLLDLNDYKIGANSFIHFKNDPNRESSINHNSIYSLFQDNQGSIWIGTFGNGINIINPMIDKFIHVINKPGVKNSLGNNSVNTFFEDSDFLWIATGGGLDRYNKRDDTFKHYIHDPLNKKSIGSDAVWSIYKDKNGSLWIGTWGGGLNRFDYKTETFEQYYNDPVDSTTIGSNNIFSILEDSRGNLWIGTMGGGLNMFDRKKKIFTRYLVTNSEINSNYIQAIAEAENGDLWFCNSSAFTRFEITTKNFEIFRHSENDSTSLSSNKVMSIFRDSKGNLWMGTDAGLNLFHESTKNFTHYLIENGLPDNSISSIQEDNKGNLWIGTNKGLSKFINAINLPAKPEFKNYTYGDGLQSNAFGRRSSYKGTDGKLYFGGTNGFNIFDPDKIIDNTYVPPIVISDLKIFNKHELIGDRGFKKDIGNTEDLVLSYKQSVFSFDFVALSYISSSKNQYAYKMEGFEENWNYVGTKRTVTYTNLDPGRYILKVKGSNNDGVWNEECISLPIVITPPFWSTLWFRLILLAAFLAVLFWIYKWRKQLQELATQKRIEGVITKERNLLRTLIDNIPDAISIKDTASRKIIANKADLFNMNRNSEVEVLGKDDFELFPREMAEGFFADDQKVIKTGQPIINREEFVIDKQEQKQWLLTTKIPLRDENNQTIGLVGIGRNITEQKKAEVERKKAEAERERLIIELQDALADVKLLSGLVPICASCKKIRDDQGYWTQIESYIQDRSDAKFSHSICPDCAAKIYPNYNIKK
jgi:PAS domain S-box-containing protein